MKARATTNLLLFAVAMLGLAHAVDGALLRAPTTPVAAEQALAEASRIAAVNPDWQVMRGAGSSMNPYFGEHSLLLVDRGTNTEIRPGMVIIYRDSEGDRVAHHVVETRGETLIAKGLNNRSHDPEMIAHDRIEGILFGVIHTAGLGPESVNLPVALGKTF